MESEINAHESCLKEARAASFPDTPAMREVREQIRRSKTSSRSSKCNFCNFPLSGLPHSDTPRIWYVGEWEQEVGGVRSLQTGIYAEAIKSEQDLQSAMPTRTWKTLCKPPMAKRVDRLKGLGNSVVPAQAREAFERLMGLKPERMRGGG